jgi:hypothetical protein
MGELGARVSVGWQRGTKTSRLHNQGHVFFILHGGGCMHGFVKFRCECFCSCYEAYVLQGRAAYGRYVLR